MGLHGTVLTMFPITSSWFSSMASMSMSRVDLNGSGIHRDSRVPPFRMNLSRNSDWPSR